MPHSTDFYLALAPSMLSNKRSWTRSFSAGRPNSTWTLWSMLDQVGWTLCIASSHFAMQTSRSCSLLSYFQAMNSVWFCADDSKRRFVVSFYMADSSVAVYEPPVSNSGFLGGKFLQRQRVRRHGTAKTESNYITHQDLLFDLPGAILPAFRDLILHFSGGHCLVGECSSSVSEGLRLPPRLNSECWVQGACGSTGIHSYCSSAIDLP